MSEKKILIIEDDPEIAKLLQRKLKKAGYQSIWAEYANQGLEFAYKGRPDLIILDLMLPGGDGASVLSGLKRSSYTNLVPIIVLTALTDFEYKNRIIKTGINEYINKPFNPGQLINKVDEILKPGHPDAKVVLKKILIIDDDRDFGKLVAKKLLDNNFFVVRAEDGLQGIRFAKLEKPDLIILDIMLPGGDGFFVLGKLKKLIETREMPVIILTGLKGPGDKDKSLIAGADDFLEKPLNMVALLNSIQKLI